VSIDFQKDHGRGQDHLSAFLEEGDVVVYQTGIWTVDGVQVGDGEVATWAWAKMDSLQVVWSHNCEHGVLRGIVLKKVKSKQNDLALELRQVEPMEIVEFGPEQLVARVPVQWQNEEQTRGRTKLKVFNDDDDDDDQMWLQATG
jgi:hypothetical protein